MPVLCIRPYYSSAWGDQWAVIPRNLLDELGLLDQDPSHKIFAHIDTALRPGRVTRFDDRETAARYVRNIIEAGEAQAESANPDT